MKVGDSFLIKHADKNKVTVSAAWWKKRHEGFAYAIRKISPNGDSRLWRIRATNKKGA